LTKGELKRGEAPSLKSLPPLFDKERGTKGVRLTKTKGGGLPKSKTKRGWGEQR
jgi:hypothetical protein